MFRKTPPLHNDRELCTEGGKADLKHNKPLKQDSLCYENMLIFSILNSH